MGSRYGTWIADEIYNNAPSKIFSLKCAGGRAGFFFQDKRVVTINEHFSFASIFFFFAGLFGDYFFGSITYVHITVGIEKKDHF